MMTPQSHDGSGSHRRHQANLEIRPGKSGLAPSRLHAYLHLPFHLPLTMASTPVINLRKGHAVRHNNEICIVTDHELKTPPRMASYVQMSIRSVATKKVFNLRLTSNDSLEGVVLERTPHEYSYKDSSGYHFLDPNTYEDAIVHEDLIEGVKNYLIEGQAYTLLIADGNVVSIELPLTMTMTVKESSEGVKGDSANNVYKPAVMETGLIVQVPLFINQGERINIKTEDNSYLGRA
jgi:elongation factor P